MDKTRGTNWPGMKFGRVTRRVEKLSRVAATGMGDRGDAGGYERMAGSGYKLTRVNPI